MIVVWLGCPSLPGRASRLAKCHRLAGQLRLEHCEKVWAGKERGAAWPTEFHLTYCFHTRVLYVIDGPSSVEVASW